MITEEQFKLAVDTIEESYEACKDKIYANVPTNLDALDVIESLQTLRNLAIINLRESFIKERLNP